MNIILGYVNWFLGHVPQGFVAGGLFIVLFLLLLLIPLWLMAMEGTRYR